MSDKIDIPFNISLLVLSPDKLKFIKPIRSLDIVDGAGSNFNSDGLFSVEIFGKVGDNARSKRFSYIDIKIPIFHPIIYKALVSLKMLYGEIISGSGYAVWNDETKDFDRANALTGQTGFAFFIEYWKQIVFKETNSAERQQNILMIEKYKNIATTDKIIVMPAGLRDIEVDSNGRMQKDEINDFYIRLLSISNTLTADNLKTNPEIVNVARNNLQRTFNGLYDTIESMLKGKKKLIMNRWASRRIYNGTRNVITSMDTSSPYLGAPGSIDVNSSLIGLYQLIKSIMPVARYQIRNGFLMKVFTSVNTPVKLVDKQTSHMVSATVDSKYFDYWMTDEGVEKIITSFGDQDLRNKPLEVDGYYLGLIYKGPDHTFKIIQDIDDVPENRSKTDVYPLTFCELIYLSCYLVLNKFPAMLTRYPIAGVGSIYPCFPHVKTTIKSEQRRELNDAWEPMDDKHIAFEFPLANSPYVNTMSPHSSKLAGLVGDFDGDVCSWTALYSDESINEINDYFSKRKAYIGTNGKFTASVNTSTVKLVLHNLTGD